MLGIYGNVGIGDRFVGISRTFPKIQECKKMNGRCSSLPKTVITFCVYQLSIKLFQAVTVTLVIMSSLLSQTIHITTKRQKIEIKLFLY